MSLIKFGFCVFVFSAINTTRGSMVPLKFYLEDIVKQAHAMKLLSQDAIVTGSAPGIQVHHDFHPIDIDMFITNILKIFLAYSYILQVGYYAIRPFEKANLNSAFGDSLPYDVIQSLESLTNQIENPTTAPVEPRNFNYRKYNFMNQNARYYSRTLPFYQYRNW